jgi:hypothetical protein
MNDLNSPDIQALPKFRFPRSVTDRQIITRAQHDLTEGRVLVPATASEMTLERWAAIQLVIHHQIAWVKKNVGVDVESRRPKDMKIKFYPDDEFRKIRLKFNIPESAPAISFPSLGQILILDRESELANLFSLGHELIDVYSNKVIGLENYTPLSAKPPTLLRDGYANVRIGKFELFNQAVVEMINIESYFSVINNLPENDKRAIMEQMSMLEIGYLPVILLVDCLIDEASKRLGKNPQDLRRDMYRGYFDGNIQSLKFFEQAFGKGALNSIGSLNESNIFELYIYRFLSFKSGFDITPFLDKLKKYYISAEEIEILGGIKLKKAADVHK